MTQKMKMAEWEGRMVRTREDLRTRGGQFIPKGSAMHVHGHWRGRLTLQSLEQPSWFIRQVGLGCVELLPAEIEK